jgi:hypothetical protein
MRACSALSSSDVEGELFGFTYPEPCTRYTGQGIICGMWIFRGGKEDVRDIYHAGNNNS